LKADCIGKEEVGDAFSWSASFLSEILEILDGAVSEVVEAHMTTLAKLAKCIFRFRAARFLMLSG